MTGTPNVSNLPFPCQLVTLGIVFFLALYDHRHHKVRNAALLAFLPWCLFSVLLSAWIDPWREPWTVLLSALSGFLCGGVLLLFTALATNGGIGGGDIKLAALLGLCYGGYGILLVLTSASILALISTGVYALLTKRHPSRIAFVPYMAAGCLLAALIEWI